MFDDLLGHLQGSSRTLGCSTSPAPSAFAPRRCRKCIWQNQMLIFRSIHLGTEFVRWCPEHCLEVLGGCLFLLPSSLLGFVLIAWTDRCQQVIQTSRCLVGALGERVICRVRHGGLLPVLILDPSGQVRLPQLRDLSGHCRKRIDLQVFQQPIGNKNTWPELLLLGSRCSNNGVLLL